MPKDDFRPISLIDSPPVFSLPDELWVSVYSHPCTFPPPIFSRVVDNLVRNPNISSSHLFRADIYYDSDSHGDAQELGLCAFTAQMREELRPKICHLPSEGWTWSRTMVRRLVPRNPNLDRELVQTVHYFRSQLGEDGQGEAMLVIQIPHVETVDEIPWYHPAVKRLAITYHWQPTPLPNHETPSGSTTTDVQGQGDISIHYATFPATSTLTDRLTKTALNILATIHRHGQGQLAGYTKRVHHDQLIPQSTFQDTYTRLKLTYAKPLIAQWAEQTDPGKHVFEDLGIAAFLIELWRVMYKERGGFPGFVDVGCGNGVLVRVLRQEGYEGWGFDARARKSWGTFPVGVREHLKEMLLVPRMLQDVAGGLDHEDGHGHAAQVAAPAWHDGVFPEGTFIISNHADELTPWTPVVASLSKSPFIAIPCCSHNFSGSRYRAPIVASPFDEAAGKRGSTSDQNGVKQDGSSDPDDERGKGHASGSLKGPKGPSAYAALTNWVAKLAADVGYMPEKEMLRIPSTRNAAVVCRSMSGTLVESDMTGREQKATRVVMEALGGQQSLEEAAREWIKRASKLHKKTSDAH